MDWNWSSLFKPTQMPLYLQSRINGKLLVVRTLRRGDVEALWDLRRDPRLIGMQHPPTEGFVEHTLALIEAKEKDPTLGVFQNAITIDGEFIGEVLGSFLLGHLNIGWHLNPEHWGNGYMPKALEMRYQELFEQDPNWKIASDVFVDNSRCIRVLEKLGYVPRPEGWLDRLCYRFLFKRSISQFRLDKQLFEQRASVSLKATV